MSCFICINKKTVLHCTRGIFDDLYYALKDTNRKEQGVKKLIDEMEFLNSTMCMYSLHIDEFIKSSEEADVIAFLLEETIHQIKHEIKEWALADLWKFHAELIKYKEELEAQGK